jgi:cytochrome c553
MVSLIAGRGSNLDACVAVFLVLAVGSTASALAQQAGSTADKAAVLTAKELRRGEHLAKSMGCSDCHTPKVMTPQGPQLDTSRLLSGYPSHTPLPAVPKGVIGPTQWGALTTNDLTAWAGPWGISFAANLTPDVSGLGPWTAQEFIQTMRTGKHLGVGRALLPPMPWSDIAELSDEDLKALFAYLKSLKPISNQVPPPVPPK